MNQRLIARVSIPELKFDKYVALEIEQPVTQELFDEAMEQIKNAMCIAFKTAALRLGGV